jgi:hypothetical protein
MKGKKRLRMQQREIILMNPCTLVTPSLGKFQSGSVPWLVAEACLATGGPTPAEHFQPTHAFISVSHSCSVAPLLFSPTSLLGKQTHQLKYPAGVKPTASSVTRACDPCGGVNVVWMFGADAGPGPVL